ncbi:5-oxoprolinase subunit B family protein [Nocardia arthritidis]|uniref:Carboxyltransferase domain-containing protein n=1 Tax=Nocardia arthritidis TaxID=228602 RepID=A0A6G9YUG2_9NOCA|nr:allophanate hydrolase subunit 1 [Nocardia arthritidis]QIS16858.1 carboxyltransferase domain-containing protein [Nocardia arthritidis]
MTDPAPKGPPTRLDPARLIRAAGDRALLLTPPDHATTTLLADRLRREPVTGVADILPASETILVTLVSPQAAEPVRKELLHRLDTAAGTRDSADVSRETVARNDFADEPVLIPVRYDGADLADVAAHLGMTTAEVIAAHTGTVWRCAFVGFAPGFGYLESPDGRLTVPRRAQSRTAIPAGSVALAGGFSAVYPRSTPGGWQLIGTTELTMWDVERDPPALVRAGAAVRFEAVR